MTDDLSESLRRVQIESPVHGKAAVEELRRLNKEKTMHAEVVRQVVKDALRSAGVGGLMRIRVMGRFDALLRAVLRG